MTKRPLHLQFHNAVLEDRKITTIRNSPWPVGEKIMLYHWSGDPYRSKHKDVCAVLVESATGISITHRENGSMAYNYPDPLPRALWICEGFESQAAMDEWFRQVVPRGQKLMKYLMRFKRVE